MSRDIRVNILGEITSAIDFDCDNLYIKYEFRKPGDWRYDEKNIKAMAELSKTDENLKELHIE